MAFKHSLVASLLSLTPLVAAQKCALQFDARVPDTFNAKTLTTPANTIFTPNFTVGAGLTISDVVEFPNVPPSLFDAKSKTKAIEVTIDDKSIFTPSPDNKQVGFRRAELMIASNNGADPSTTGIKVLHFSVMKDTTKAFNPAHEYQMVWLESADFATNQIVLKTGTIIGQEKAIDPDMLTLFGNVNSSPIPVLFQTKFTPGVFHNFGVKLDFTKNTTQVFYSEGATAPLKAVGNGSVPNNIAGRGQYHFGVLKKGLGGNGDPKKGTQEPGIKEGIIYGGLFMEDGSAGCVSLSP